MVKQRMDLLELLRKRGMDGDVDFLREALRVLVDGIMDAEVSAQSALRRRTAQSGSPTAASGTPASAPWSCTFPSCGRAVLPQPAGTTLAVIQQAYVEGHPKGG